MQSKAVINNLIALAITYAAKGDMIVARGIVATIEGKRIIIEVDNTKKNST